MTDQSKSSFNIEIQFLAGLKKSNPDNEMVQVCGHETISDILNRLGIERDLICAVIFNGTFINFDARLNSDGTLKLLPAVGGG